MYTYIHAHKFSNNNYIFGRAAGRAGSPHATSSTGKIGRQENSTSNVNFWASTTDKQFRVNKTLLHTHGHKLNKQAATTLLVE